MCVWCVRVCVCGVGGEDVHQLVQVRATATLRFVVGGQAEWLFSMHPVPCPGMGATVFAATAMGPHHLVSLVAFLFWGRVRV